MIVRIYIPRTGPECSFCLTELGTFFWTCHRSLTIASGDKLAIDDTISWTSQVATLKYAQLVYTPTPPDLLPLELNRRVIIRHLQGCRKMGNTSGVNKFQHIIQSTPSPIPLEGCPRPIYFYTSCTTTSPFGCRARSLTARGRITVNAWLNFDND